MQLLSLKKILGIGKDDESETNHVPDNISESKNLVISFLLSLIFLCQLNFIFFLQKHSLAGIFFLADVILLLSLYWYNRQSERKETYDSGKKSRAAFFLPFFLLLFALYFLQKYLQASYGTFLSFKQIILVLILFGALLLNGRVEAYLRDRYKIKLAFILAASLIFSFYLWGNNLNAKWGLIDDHMMMHYFIDNPDGVSIYEIPRLLAQKTEVGNFGHSTINRPFYYLGRLIEAVFWQKNVFFWYLGRLFMFFLSVAISWWLLQKILGVFLGGIFLGFIFLDPYWGWIWGYLGPAESYAMFGSALFLLGFFNIICKIKEGNMKSNYLAGSILLALGSFIAIGAKENFLFLFLPLIYLVIFLFKKKVKKPAVIASLLLIFAYGLYIFAGIYLGLAKAGGDVYGQNIELSERLRLTASGLYLAFAKVGATWIIFSFFAVGVLTKLFKKENIFKKYKQLVKIFFVVSFILLVLYLSQLFFYNGYYPPSALRYSFPGMLAVPFFALLLFSTTFSVLRLIGMDKKIIRNTASVIFVVLFAIVLADGYRDSRNFVKKNVSETTEFSKEIDKTVINLKNHPEQPVVLDSYSVWNVEPIASVHAYLLANNVQNSMFLRLNFPPVDSGDPGRIDQKISDFLSYVSLGEGCGFTGSSWTFLSGGDCDQWSFSPIMELDSQSNYVSVKINEENKVSSEIQD